MKIFKKFNLIPIISNLSDYDQIKKLSVKYGIQINTGINRLGINYNDYKQWKSSIDNMPKLIEIIKNNFWIKTSNRQLSFYN